jgi:hypothetical protein
VLADALARAGRNLDRAALARALRRPTRASRLMRWDPVANRLVATEIFPPHASPAAIGENATEREPK